LRVRHAHKAKNHENQRTHHRVPRAWLLI
jgi:hypothetical protein